MYNLFEALREFDESVRNEIIEDYEEHFAAGAASGKTEEQIVEELGSIDELINDLRDLSGKGGQKKNNEKAGEEAKDFTDDIVKGVSNLLGSIAGIFGKGASAVSDEVYNTIKNAMGEDTTQGNTSSGEAFKEYSAEAVDKIVADTDCGNIIVTKSLDGKVHFTYENHGTSNQQLAYKFDYKQNGSTMYVSVKKQLGTTSFFKSLSSPKILLSFQIPDNFASVDAKSMSGDVKALGIKSAEVKLASMSGNVLAQEVIGRDLDESTMSGNATAENCNFINAKVKTVSGNAEYMGAVENVSVHSTSGNVKVDGRNLKSVNANSVSGSVYILLTDASGITANVNTVSGRSNISYGLSKANNAKSGKYYYGDGSVMINAKTVSGNVTING